MNTESKVIIDNVTLQQKNSLGEPKLEEKIPRYLWLVLASSFLGWMFDAMDLNLLSLVLGPSVIDLVHQNSPAIIGKIGGTIMAIKLFAWGLGGVIFGILTDRFGRARIMLITILIYSIFTALSALSQSWVQFAVLQAIAGLGIGGEWSAGAALVAETWPMKYRAKALQFMQMAFAFGFFMAALVNILLGPLGWRWVFVAGAIPAIVTIFIRRWVKEPERWVQTRKTADTPKLSRIFKPDLLRVTLVGSVVALAMMVGCWGGLTWIPTWIVQLTANKAHAPANVSYAMMLMNVGAALGYITLMWLTEAIGRRKSYFLFCTGALVVSLYLFLNIHSVTGIMVVMPFYGYFAIGGFGTFAIYLPELFPTFVRATGQGFCWNIARLLTGVGPLASGLLISVFGSITTAAAVISVVFVLGMIGIWFGHETKGKEIVDF